MFKKKQYKFGNNFFTQTICDGQKIILLVL
jgi:hypothetical protein